MNFNFTSIIVLAVLAIGINVTFFSYITFHLDSRKKNLIENGTEVQSTFKEVNYNQGRKWNEYRVTTTYVNPTDRKVQEFTSDWIRGMAPKDISGQFKTYIDPANSENYYIDVTDLKKSFFRNSVLIIVIAVVFLVAVAGAVFYFRRPV